MRDLEKSARADYLAATSASRATDRARARFRAVAVAFVANIQLSNFDFFFGAKRGFFERDLHIVTQVRAALSIFGPAAHSAEEGFENSAANSTRAKDFPENIEGIMKTAAESAALLERGVTEAIVSGAFVRIHQDVVSFAKLLEFFFSVRVVRVFVGMKFHRELAIGALYFFG